MKLTPPFVIVIDRTEWKFGSTWHNILTLSLASEDVAVPILWRFLKRKGCSDDAERETLMNIFCNFFRRQTFAMSVPTGNLRALSGWSF
jgi:hypothetical protein